MILASALAADRTALICDLAETYGVLDYKALPVTTLAALCAGLREDSRTRMKKDGWPIPRELFFLVAAVDRLSLLVWSKTADAAKGRNRPRSLLEFLCGTAHESDVMSFDTAEEFEAERKRILEGGI